ncbi:patatin-like phospholipase family protein [Sphingobacterium psychroaquaticum]|uniref:NTE family protein n=1 Tax=Sphingobacterium psychroaquaticum TaxID=561061 RepID=A0A1X7IGR7_9SPHI|nr:patatin-like phospholipase family protein [Sphingobacterium psychroaquaticum]SMG13847.1 NTE family protein [Sphingobacterium psychroaquaticum]
MVKDKKSKKKVSLVLGSGGARGLTQIGVIRYLEEEGYEVDEIIGCSIGSLIGGAFACGGVYRLADWMQQLTKTQVFRLMDFSNSRQGLLRGTRVLNTLQDIFSDIDIEDLPQRYVAVATDLAHEREVLFEKGSLYDAIRASIAIPGVFLGVARDNTFLVDGGVLNPLPVNHVSNKENLIVAVNLEGAYTEPRIIPSKLNAMEILQESYFAMRRRLISLTIDRNQPDYLIDISHDAAGIWDFHRAHELIEIGYKEAKRVFAQPQIV